MDLCSFLNVGGFCFLQGPLEQKNELGIMFRHAYSLTAVEKVQTQFVISVCFFPKCFSACPLLSDRFKPHMELNVWCGS